MKGYFEDPQATAYALRDGWMHTDDAAVVHPDGYVEIRNRLNDVIISGDENISSVEVKSHSRTGGGPTLIEAQPASM